MNIEQYTVAPIPCKASQRCPQEAPTNDQQYQYSLLPTGARHEVCLPGTVERWRSRRAWHSVVSGRIHGGAGRNLNSQPDNDLFSLVRCPVAIVRVFKFRLTFMQGLPEEMLRRSAAGLAGLHVQINLVAKGHPSAISEVDPLPSVW